MRALADFRWPNEEADGYQLKINWLGRDWRVDCLRKGMSRLAEEGEKMSGWYEMVRDDTRWYEMVRRMQCMMSRKYSCEL